MEICLPALNCLSSKCSTDSLYRHILSSSYLVTVDGLLSLSNYHEFRYSWRLQFKSSCFTFSWEIVDEKWVEAILGTVQKGFLYRWFSSSFLFFRTLNWKFYYFLEKLRNARKRELENSLTLNELSWTVQCFPPPSKREMIGYQWHVSFEVSILRTVLLYVEQLFSALMMEWVIFSKLKGVSNPRTRSRRVLCIEWCQKWRRRCCQQNEFKMAISDEMTFDFRLVLYPTFFTLRHFLLWFRKRMSPPLRDKKSNGPTRKNIDGHSEGQDVVIYTFRFTRIVPLPLVCYGSNKKTGNRKDTKKV